MFVASISHLGLIITHVGTPGRAADRGRRLDHVWGSPDLVPLLSGLKVLKDARDWERPSDHVPVLVTLDL